MKLEFLSLIHGHSEPSLSSWTIGELLSHQATHFPSRPAIIVPTEYTYYQLNKRTTTLARALLAWGLRPGDRVAIFSGNCDRFVEVFLAVARIGAVAVLFHSTFTLAESLNAVAFTGCSLMFASTFIGIRDLWPCLVEMRDVLRGIVLLRAERNTATTAAPFHLYDDFINGPLASEDIFVDMEKVVQGDDVCNFQFTSGTTGNSKVGMLTHQNIIRNGTLIGDRLRLTEQDVICCAFPLFHSGGLVTGLLACLTHASGIVFPAPAFSVTATLRALAENACTGFHGVPTMFADVLEKYRQQSTGPISMRTGIIGGAPVPQTLLKGLQREFGLPQLAVAYGMTETSPLSFMSRITDQADEVALTEWQILPHTAAKVVNAAGFLVPRGTPGELCIAGYLLQKGYYKNPEQTQKSMRRDAAGILWMHTGDEAMLDVNGYCRITGRLKEMIIRGGEKIHPAEIENRLAEHPAVAQSCVVGLHDDRLGEVVAAFLQPGLGVVSRPSTEEMQQWVRAKLGAHKAPLLVFWVGENDDLVSFPVTGSGKVKRHTLVDIGNRFLRMEKT